MPTFRGSANEGYTMTINVPIDPTTAQAGSGQGPRR